MNFYKLISRLTNESERDLRTRFRIFGQLIKGNDSPRDFLDDPGIELSGRIYMITTWRPGKGEEDFKQVLNRKNHKIRKAIRLNWFRDGGLALYQAIQLSWDEFKSGDILAIVRGGGDTDDKQFLPFKEPDAAKLMESLRKEKSVIIITGIGHASDSFLVEGAATFKQATPTDAAYKVCELLNSSED